MPAPSRAQTSLGEVAAAAGAGFGTSGVRGLVSSLTPELCAAYATAFLSILEARPRALLIGHDLRPSSPAMGWATPSLSTRARPSTM